MASFTQKTTALEPECVQKICRMYMSWWKTLSALYCMRAE